jgi:hypothetical protein
MSAVDMGILAIIGFVIGILIFVLKGSDWISGRRPKQPKDDVGQSKGGSDIE